MTHRSDPRSAGIQADVANPVARLLDQAHAELPAPELARLLLALEEPAGRLAAAKDPIEGVSVTLSPPALAVLLPIRRLLEDASGDGSPEGRSRLGDWLIDYLDEVAARPRGAALAAVAA
jgi:hypothetical protein